MDLYDRFGDYPYFIESFSQYTDLRVPRQVPVEWVSLNSVLTPIFADSDEEADQSDAWIKEVVQMLRRGEDVPPILMIKDEIFDGRHRAQAASYLKLKLAPIVDLTPYRGK